MLEDGLEMKITIVIIIATLHQFHAQCNFYSLDHLRTIIEKINPDIICVELTAEDLKSKKDQAIKIEYPKCIIPLAKKKGYKLIPMEPNEPEYSRLVNKYKQAYQKIDPKKKEIFNLYTKLLFDYLFAYWKSLVDVNSQLTNALFELKHKFQNSLFGSVEEQCWEDWNNHFLNTILKVAETHKGKNMLVAVGVEHVYWLKKHLKSNSTIKIVEFNEAVDE